MYGARFQAGMYTRDAIGSHTCSLEVNMRVINAIPLGGPLPLTVATINSVQTIRVYHHAVHIGQDCILTMNSVTTLMTSHNAGLPPCRTHWTRRHGALPSLAAVPP
jgi:hypothetical protein